MAGRPPKWAWDEPERLQAAVDEYFDKCEKRIITKQVVSKGEVIKMKVPTPPTIIGLCVHLDISEQCLSEYGNSEAFGEVISRARARVKEATASVAMIGALEPKIAGLILSSDFGYTTKSQVDLSVETLEDVLGKLASQGKTGE